MTSTVTGYMLLGVAALLVIIGNVVIQRMTALES
jgi:Flp pilus assembly protein TadB